MSKRGSRRRKVGTEWAGQEDGVYPQYFGEMIRIMNATVSSKHAAWTNHLKIIRSRFFHDIAAFVSANVSVLIRWGIEFVSCESREYSNIDIGSVIQLSVACDDCLSCVASCSNGSATSTVTLVVSSLSMLAIRYSPAIDIVWQYLLMFELGMHSKTRAWLNWLNS
jgi:ferredoxin